MMVYLQTPSITIFTGFKDNVVFTMGAKADAMVPTKSVFASIISRNAGFFLLLFDTRQLDNVANLHIRRASHFTAFTVQTIFQRLIKVFASLQAKTLLIRTGLLRTGILGIHRNNRTIYRTDRTLDTLLKIVSLILFCCIFMTSSFY